MTNQILDKIARERHRQDLKWGEQNHTDERWLTILVEEVGELAKEIYEGNKADLTDELVQVAAVAIVWLEAIQRRDRDKRAQEP